VTAIDDDEQLATWFETANGGRGPVPVARLERPDFDAIVAAVEARDAAQREVDLRVAQARDHGASWTLIGAALGVTRQSAHERYAKA